MKFYQILSWFKRNLKDIILSQRKTLAYLVFGMMNARKASLIAIAKGMKSKTSVKHNLKRVARFMANKRIDIKKSMYKLQMIVIKNNKNLFITLDWTTISKNGYQILKATVIGDGRGIPFAFKTYKEGEIKKQQTELEKDFLSYIESVIPKTITVYIIGDRGFGQKPELLKHINKLGFIYIIRCNERYFIKNKDYSGKLSDLITIKEIIYDLKDVAWPNSKWYGKKRKHRDRKKLNSRFIIYQGKKQRIRWVICTNSNQLCPNKIIDIYYKRMTIEETFKDIKNIERGYAIESVKLSEEERYDKMLLILSYAYLLLTLFGLIMETKNMHKKIMANTVKYRSISLFQVGLYYFKYYEISIPEVLKYIKNLVFII
jgi:hypothetical protein